MKVISRGVSLHEEWGRVIRKGEAFAYQTAFWMKHYIRSEKGGEWERESEGSHNHTINQDYEFVCEGIGSIPHLSKQRRYGRTSLTQQQKDHHIVVEFKFYKRPIMRMRYNV